MNALVLGALRRTYNLRGPCILIPLLGSISIRRTLTDIFPPIRIPVAEMARSTQVNGVLISKDSREQERRFSALLK
jgi:hypothetical protein